MADHSIFNLKTRIPAAKYGRRYVAWAASAPFLAVSEENKVTWIYRSAEFDVWNLLGEIDTPQPGNHTVSLSADGTRIAIGGTCRQRTQRNNFHVTQVYKWFANNSISTLGQHLTTSFTSNISSFSCSSAELSGDGTHLSISTFDPESNVDAGKTKIYEYDSTKLQWNPRRPVNGGVSSSMSANGQTIVVNGPGLLSVHSLNSRVYNLDISADYMNPNRLSVSMNDAGDRLIVAGYVNISSGDYIAAYLQMFDYKDDTRAWTPTHSKAVVSPNRAKPANYDDASTPIVSLNKIAGTVAVIADPVNRYAVKWKPNKPAAADERLWFADGNAVAINGNGTDVVWTGGPMSNKIILNNPKPGDNPNSINAIPFAILAFIFVALCFLFRLRR